MFSTSVHANDKMLIAVTVMKSLDVVCEYGIQLAKRIEKNMLLFVLLVLEHDLSDAEEETAKLKLLDLIEHGKGVGIDIQTQVVQGDFSDKVAEFLFELDCPLLVVGEGDDREKRLRELKKIEANLLANKAWHHRNSHHFLMVSERQKDSVLFVLNQNQGKKGGKKKNE